MTLQSRLSRVLLAALAVGLVPAVLAAQSEIQVVRSFEDLPPLPRTSAEVQQRYGKLTDPKGTSLDGDTKIQPLYDRMAGWTKSMMQAAMANAMNSGGARASAITPAAGQALGAMTQTFGELSTGLAQAVQSYAAATRPIDAAYDKHVTELDTTYYRTLERGGCMDPTPKKIDCTAVAAERDQAIRKAGDAYLAQIAVPYAAYVAKLKGMAGQAKSAVDGAAKAFNGNVPSYARGMYQGLTASEMNALGQAINADSHAVELVYRKSVEPTMRK